MPFTVDLDNPIGQVRFEIGDDAEAEALFTDDQITYKLDEVGGVVLAAAAALCNNLAIRFAYDYDFKWKDGEFKRSQRAEHFRKLGADIVSRLSVADGITVVETTRIDGFSQEVAGRDTDATPDFDHDFNLQD